MKDFITDKNGQMLVVGDWIVHRTLDGKAEGYSIVDFDSSKGMDLVHTIHVESGMKAIFNATTIELDRSIRCYECGSKNLYARIIYSETVEADLQEDLTLEEDEDVIDSTVVDDMLCCRDCNNEMAYDIEIVDDKKKVKKVYRR